MAFEFKSGQPRKRPAEAATVTELRRHIRNGFVPEAAKTVGSGTVLVYGAEINYYISDGERLRALLLRFEIEP